MKGVSSAPGDYVYFKSQVPLHRIPVSLSGSSFAVISPLLSVNSAVGSFNLLSFRSGASLLALIDLLVTFSSYKVLIFDGLWSSS